MTITATRNYQTVVFTWNDELTECSYNAVGTSDQDIEEMISKKVHEGKDALGWITEIDLGF